MFGILLALCWQKLYNEDTCARYVLVLICFALRNALVKYDEWSSLHKSGRALVYVNAAHNGTQIERGYSDVT